MSAVDSPDRTVTVVSTPALARSRTAVPVLTESPPDADADLHRLLARRLRQAFVILTVIYAAFLVVHFTVSPRSIGWETTQAGSLAVALAVQAAVAGVACGFRGHTRWLPIAEWVTLVNFWGVIGGNMFAGLNHPAEIDLLTRFGRVGQSILANTWLLPWFAVMAGYPVLVPNTPRRTAVIVGITAAMPFVVSAAVVGSRPELSFAHIGAMYVQFTVWGLIGLSIAVYGARQAALLRKEAFEAKKFGQYRLLHKLDAGGMGEVFLAEHRLLRRPSVIKPIRPDRQTDPKMHRRFEREVKRLATLTHWNTVEVYDYGHTADGTFYFVMEHLPGMNLNDLVKRHGPLPPGRAVFLIRQVCRGLREAHQVDLIHRDIKPANIMTCERGGLFDVAKLLDFGLVQAPEDNRDEDAKLTREGVILGTPAFLSPDQACGEGLDARSDLYSLGCTLFYLLTGKPPFNQSGAAAVVSAHIYEPPPTPPGAPTDLAAVVLKCMAKKREDRYATARDLEQALDACACAADWDHDRAEAWWRANREG